MAENLKISDMVDLFKSLQESESSSEKLREFLIDKCTPPDYFAAARLIIPILDGERACYGLTDSMLARCLIRALGISGDNPDALRLINWRKSENRGAGVNGGNFALLAAELILKHKRGNASCGLTIKELNNHLDLLVSSKSRADKTSVLSTLLDQTSGEEMKWLIRVLVKHTDPMLLRLCEDLRPFNFFEDPRFFALSTVKILSILRQREDVTLAVQFTVKPSERTNTSLKVELQLQKTIQKVYRDFVSKVFTLYEEDRQTLDIWIFQTVNTDFSDPSWTTLKTKNMKKNSARNFAEDEDNVLLCAVISQGLKTAIYSGPPSLFDIEGYFLPHSLENEGFPHVLAVIVGDLGFDIESRMKAWDQQTSSKIAKGLLFILCRVKIVGDLDRTIVNVRNTYSLPRFFVEGIKKTFDVSVEIPRQTRFFLKLVEQISLAPENLLEIQVQFAAELRDKLYPHEILDLLGSSIPYVEALQIKHFVENTCNVLGQIIQGMSIAEDPLKQIFDLFGLKTSD